MVESDIGPYLDPAHQPAGADSALVRQLTDIIRAATARAATEDWPTALECRRRPGRRACDGRIVVALPDPAAPIRWVCSSCGDTGAITGWAGSAYDLRPCQPAAVGDTVAVPVGHDVVAALRELLFLDPDCERVVFAARSTGDRAVLTATLDDLEQLADAVAAEANHEPRPARQRRFDAAFDALRELLR